MNEINVKNLVFAVGVFFIICVANLSHAAAPENGYFKTADGARLRYATWPSIGTPLRKVKILLLQGRASFIEKNIEFMEDLAKLGFTVVTFDWRGMGGSGRTLNHPQKGHIDSFNIYLKDLDQFIEQVVKPQSQDALVLLGASMGGQLALRYMHDYPGKANAAILLAPMLDVKTDPFPRWIAEPMVRLICALGFSDAYAFGYGDFDPFKANFSKDKETGDEKRFWKTIDTIKQNPQYVIGGPTFGWVKAAFESMNKTRQPDYLQEIYQPILLMAAGDDRILINKHDEAICQKMPRCHYKLFAGAAHNLAKEKDHIRNAMIWEVDRFIAEIVER